MPDETINQPTPESQQPVAQQESEATPQQAVPVQQPAAAQVPAKGTTGMGIASLVLGILALLSSFLPIINNASFFLALIGAILGIVGIVATRNGKKGGKGIAIAGVILNVLSVVIVLVTQSIYSAAIDSAVDELENGSTPVATTTAESADADGAQAAAKADEPAEADTDNGEQDEADYSNMPIGQSVEFKDGLSVSVDAVTPGLVNYDDSPITGVTVTYKNNGDKNLSFNVFDWQAQDINGVLNRQAYYSDAESPLNSGKLAPGGTITGNIYFDGELTKVYYYDSILQSNSEVGWALQ